PHPTMTSREPGTLRNALGRRHDALRRRLVLRQGLRGAALAIVAVTLAVLAGVAFGVGVGFAWVPLRPPGRAVRPAGGLAGGGVRRCRATPPAFDTYLERAETSSPEIRSWLRNAVDFSAHEAAPGTSTELAQAVEREAAGRVERLPLDRLEPPLDPRRPIYLF